MDDKDIGITISERYHRLYLGADKLAVQVAVVPGAILHNMFPECHWKVIDDSSFTLRYLFEVTATAGETCNVDNGWRMLIEWYLALQFYWRRGSGRQPNVLTRKCNRLGVVHKVFLMGLTVL